MNKLIAQGAEAKITLSNNQILKSRIPKSYRLPQLDEKIRKRRTKREAKLLEKASKLIPIPKVLSSSLSDFKIKLEYIKGKKLSESLDSIPKANQICSQIGKQISTLHDNEIIHGDLTTSNMILQEKTNNLYFIDFGLSFNSNKAEDKAVDLHLIKQALEAKHHSYFQQFFSSILKGYSQSKNSSSVIERLKKVEARGRYKAQF